MDKEAAFKRTVLFGGLRPEALTELARLARERDLAQGEMLFLVGEKAAGLFVIVSGRIRAFRVNAQGREQTLHVESAGATLAEVPVFDDGAYPATAIAEEPATVLFLAKDDVRQFLLRHPELGLTALKLMAQRLRGHAELVDALSLQQVGQRIARYLLDHAKGSAVDLAITNEELARQVGSVREVVSRTLARLERDGLIEQTSAGKRRSIVIPNISALAHYAGQDNG
ncbi:MAG TPA: Crp/Fnr family transcriptional regulator [Bryobacteraceae bacterium]|nr:Crp/Fnr family transcriptional regulator [Bryobacteraceae bacterium]